MEGSGAGQPPQFFHVSLLQLPQPLVGLSSGDGFVGWGWLWIPRAGGLYPLVCSCRVGGVGSLGSGSRGLGGPWHSELLSSRFSRPADGCPALSVSRSARACCVGCPGAVTAALPAICCRLIVVLLK